MKFLIVDDEPLAIARLTRLLGSLGHTSIASASNGAEALGLVASREFDIAFLDVSMTGMDGIELGHILRERHEGLAIINQTAHETFALQAFGVGAVDYLLKPYSAEQIERAIERVTAKAKPKELRLIAKAGDNHYLLTPGEIYYVKADLSEVIFRTDKGFSYYPKKISELETLLEPYGFLRIHRSYLINLRRVDEMETINQSRIRFTFEGIDENVESSKEGAKQFRNRFKGEEE